MEFRDFIEAAFAKHPAHFAYFRPQQKGIPYFLQQQYGISPYSTSVYNPVDIDGQRINAPAWINPISHAAANIHAATMKTFLNKIGRLGEPTQTPQERPFSELASRVKVEKDGLHLPEMQISNDELRKYGKFAYKIRTDGELQKIRDERNRLRSKRASFTPEDKKRYDFLAYQRDNFNWRKPIVINKEQLPNGEKIWLVIPPISS
jgi:hypothetical protein